MPESQPNNSFSWGDALFLYLERPGQPLSIASVSVFEGAIPLKACRDFVESKLPLVPRYRQHVVFPPLNIGLPSWQFDPNFDIRNHIHQVSLRHGTERDLKALASKIVSTHLDRQKPLWDLTLVRGLEGNRTGLIVRIHHCLADGIAGLAMMNVLMDPSPLPQPLARKQPALPAPPARDAGAQLLDGLVKSYFSAVKGALTLQSEVLNIAQEMMANPSGPLNDLMKVMPELASPAERLPFNVICQGPQKFGWTGGPDGGDPGHPSTLWRDRERCHPRHHDSHHPALCGAARRAREGALGPDHDSSKCARQRQRQGAWQSHLLSSRDHSAGYSRSTEAVRLRAGTHGNA